MDRHFVIEELNSYKVQILKCKTTIDHIKDDKAAFIKNFEKEGKYLESEATRIDVLLDELGKYNEQLAMLLPTISTVEGQQAMFKLSKQYNVESFLDIEADTEALEKRIEEFQKRENSYENDIFFKFDHLIEAEEYEISVIEEIMEGLRSTD